MVALNHEWRKSTRSNTNGACVKVRVNSGMVEVGDTKQDGRPDQPVLSFSPAEWEAFQYGIRNGEFVR